MSEEQAWPSLIAGVGFCIFCEQATAIEPRAKIGECLAKALSFDRLIYKILNSFNVTTDAGKGKAAMNVLIIDDYESSRLGTALFMRELAPDINVFHANDCESGIRIAQLQPLNLIMLDIRFPRGHLQGLEALVEIKRQFESLCVVVYSGVDDNRELVFDALRKGAMGFIPKGLGKADFIKALRNILAGSPYLPPFVTVPSGETGSTGMRTSNPTELGLTSRQFDVLRWFVQGLSNKEIAQRMEIAPDTVKNHLKPIFVRFGVTTRTQLIAEIYRQGILLGPPEIGNS